MSPDSLLVTAKIAVRETDSAAQVAAGIDTAERRIRAAVPIAKTIYLEPDIYRPFMADRTDPSIRAVLRGRSPRSPRRVRPKEPQNPRDIKSPKNPEEPEDKPEDKPQDKPEDKPQDKPEEPREKPEEPREKPKEPQSPA
jgi:outer membrane biosynthesis protein TonB